MVSNDLTCDQMISLVIPVYRSAESLPELHQRIAAVFDAHKGGFEILFVEDCGGDESWEVIGRLAKSDARVRGFRMSRNYGQHNALLCGIRYARGDVIVTIDDDLQHPPEEVPKLITRLNQGFDVVYGPPEREQHGLLRDLASKLTKYGLESAMGAANASKASALRVFRSSLREAFSGYHGATVNIDVLLSWGAARYSWLAVSHQPRLTGQSGYTPIKLIGHAINMATGFSTRPLRFASVAGVFTALLGALLLTYVLINWLLYGSAVPGFAFLAASVAIFSGVQLIALGFIGEYLAKMYHRSMEKPTYVVKESIDNQSGCRGSLHR